MSTMDGPFMPMTDEEWIAFRPPNQCEAPGCTDRARRRAPQVDEEEKVPELRDRLVLCKGHYDLIKKGFVACWGEPPLDVVWRLGTGPNPRWYRNEAKLNEKQVATWFRARGEEFPPKP